MRCKMSEQTHEPLVAPAPAVLYLVPDDEGRYTWCDNYAPEVDEDKKRAVKYLRADAIGVENLLALIAECEAELAKYTL